MDYKFAVGMILNCTVIGTVLAFAIMVIRIVFKEKIKAKYYYALWFVLVARLLIPYVPIGSLYVTETFGKNYEYFFQKEAAIIKEGQERQESSAESAAKVNSLEDGDGISLVKGSEATSKNEDLFSKLKNSAEYYYNAAASGKRIYEITFYIWIAGVLAFAIYTFLFSVLYWGRVKNGYTVIDEKKVAILEKCKKDMELDTNVVMTAVDSIKVPALFGIIRPWLLMPDSALKSLGDKELRFIVLHELAHLKRKDIVSNWIVCFVQILHWFNPFIWLAFSRMRADRELACDSHVLKILDGSDIKEYGHTILNMVENYSEPRRFAGMAGILENGKDVKRRIKMIGAFKKNASRLLPLMTFIFLVLGSSVLINVWEYPFGKSQKEVSAAVGETSETQAGSNEKAGQQAITSEEGEVGKNTDTVDRNGTFDKENRGEEASENRTTGEQPSNDEYEDSGLTEKNGEESGKVIDLAKIYPGLRGTVQRVNRPVEYVKEDSTGVVLISIKPAGKLIEGKETYVMAEVEYCLAEEGYAFLNLCFNNGNDPEGDMERAIMRVSKGSGRYVFNIPVKPVFWDKGTAFRVSSRLRDDNGSPVSNADKRELVVYKK